MFTSNSPQRLTRRDFLKTVSAAMSLAAIAPVLPSGLTQFSPQSTWVPGHTGHAIQVGMLLPTSTLYPAMGDNFLAGMRHFLQQTDSGGPEIELSVIRVDPGPWATQKALQKLIEQKGIDLAIAMVDPTTSLGLSPLLHEHQTPLIAAHIGANMARPEDYSPYIFQHTLNYWQANWAMGRWAAEKLGQTALVAMSFYDSGYDTPFAFQQGFEAADGVVVETHVSHVPPGVNTFEPLFAKIEAIQPDFVYGLYCGQPAIEFVKAWARRGLSPNLPLVGAGFMVDEALLPQQEQAALGLKSSLSWHPTLDTPENIAFQKSFRTATRREADIFAFFGYDTAHLLLTAIGTVEGDPRQLDNLMGALALAQVERPLYLREVGRDSGQLRNRVIANLGSAAEAIDHVQPESGGWRTGWINSYLVA